MFSRQDIYKSAAEYAEVIRVLDVFVQRSRVELRQNEDPVDSGVDAVRDGDMNDAILTAERHRGF